MTAPVIANPTAPVGVVLIDPTTGLPYTPSSGGFLPGYQPYASPTGTSNDVNPGGGWPTSISRLDVTLASGNAEWTGLLAGTDGQMVEIFNADATNTLTLDANPAGSVAGSAAANRFQFVGNLALPPGASAIAVYSAGTVNRWRIR
jgi:hypothetical protein